MNSKFDPDRSSGISVIIRHLESCALQNEADGREDRAAMAVAKEQRRMLKILRRYRQTRFQLFSEFLEWKERQSKK